jgi:asparagine synthase (glutamine-hydrolysing)
MPGIAGIIRTNPDDATEREVGQMVEAMRHERHYVGGQQVFRDQGVCVGWVGPQGGFSDCMPLVSRAGDFVIVFQGETFLDADTRDSLAKLGHSVDANSASYLADLYAGLGEEFLKRLNGWFCGLIVDLRKRSATVFNDRYGMGRLYYHEGKDEFIFASEAKALLKIRPALRAIDPRGLAETLRYNCVLENRSLFTRVSLLPHASAWTFTGLAAPAKRTYFSFDEWEQQPLLGEDAFFPKFADAVSRVFPAYAKASSGVAFSLTAGLDTRAIMAALKELNHDIPCYTFGGPWRELYDIETARKLTSVYGQPFSTVIADDRFLKGFGDFARRAVYISDGAHDAFGAHDIYFNEVARNVAAIRLTGKFGSEVVRVRNLVPSMHYPPGLLRGELAAMVEGLPAFSQVNRDLHPLTRVVTREIPWHEYGRVVVEQSQVVLRSPYMDNELVKLMYRAPAAARAKGDLQEAYVRHRSPELATIPTNLGRFVPGGQWGKRFHYALLWGIFKVEYIYLYATPHWLTHLDRSLDALHLERLLAGRQKWEGYRIWIKTHFSEFIKDTLLNPNARYTDYLARRSVETMLSRHLNGTHNYLNEINRALTLELICSTMLRGQ